MKNLSIISRSMIVILISLSPVLLPAQKTTEIKIIDKLYVPPAKTPKIPPGFKKKGARFVVRAGDVIKICNSDKFFAKPFSYNKDNRFEGISGKQGLAPGNCITVTANNPTNKPAIWGLYDEIHVDNKLVLVVLPANWPDEGEENTPSNGGSSTENTAKCGLGKSWDETESGGWKSVWTRQGETDIFLASYTSSAGGKAETRNSVTLNGNQILIHRLSSTDTYTCEYKGTIGSDGVTIKGTYKCPNAWSGERPWGATIKCN